MPFRQRCDEHQTRASVTEATRHAGPRTMWAGGGYFGTVPAAAGARGCLAAPHGGWGEALGGSGPADMWLVLRVCLASQVIGATWDRNAMGAPIGRRSVSV